MDDFFWQQVAKSFLMSTIHSFLKDVCYRQTEWQTQAVVTLEIRNSWWDHLGATHILTLRHPCLGFDQYFVNRWARSTNQPLCQAAATSIS